MTKEYSEMLSDDEKDKRKKIASKMLWENKHGGNNKLCLTLGQVWLISDLYMGFTELVSSLTFGFVIIIMFTIVVLPSKENLILMIKCHIKSSTHINSMTPTQKKYSYELYNLAWKVFFLLQAVLKIECFYINVSITRMVSTQQ